MEMTPLSRGERRVVQAPLFLRVAFWLSIVIAVAVVVRRLVALASPSPSGPPMVVSLDRAFDNHLTLTLAHIIPALAFVVLTPIVVFRKAEPIQPLFFALGGIVGFTAYAMSIDSVGGWIERSAVLVFNTVFLYSLWEAFHRRNQPVQKRRWLIRAIVVLLGIATTRPVMGIFFATSPITHLKPNQFFGLAFWIGFSINFLIVEIWLRKHHQT